MKLEPIYFYLILAKKKIYEVRVYDTKRKKLNLFDLVVFTNTDSSKSFTARIIELSFFNTFRDAIKNSGIKTILPNATSLENGIKLYESFPHSEGTYKLGAKKFGVVRLKFELCE